MVLENERLVRAFYDYLAGGDIDQAVSLFRDGQTLWAVPGRGALAGEHEGREAIRTALQQWEKGGYGRLERSMHALCAAGDNDHVYAQYVLRMERDGVTAKVGVIDAWHVRDGELAHVWTFFEDQYLFDEWSGPG